MATVSNLLRNAKTLDVGTGTQAAHDIRGAWTRAEGKHNGQPWFKHDKHAIYTLKFTGQRWQVKNDTFLTYYWDETAKKWMVEDEEAGDAPRHISIMVSESLIPHQVQDDHTSNYTLDLTTRMLDSTPPNLQIKLKDGSEIGVHRSLIHVSCPAWAGLLESGCREAKEGEIRVEDAHPDHVRTFVKALYTGKFEPVCEGEKKSGKKKKKKKKRKRDEEKKECAEALCGVISLADRYQCSALLGRIIGSEVFGKMEELKNDTDLFCMLEDLARQFPDGQTKKDLIKALHEAEGTPASIEIWCKRRRLN